MRHNRMRVAIALVSLAMLGPIGAASAEVTSSPSAGPSASPSAGPSASPSAIGTPTPGAPAPAAAADQPPVTQPDDATVVAGQTVLIDVLANDTDPDGDPLTLTAVAGDPHASIGAGQAHDEVSFTTAATNSGTAAFTYTVDDGQGHAVVGQVTVAITAAPVPVVHTVGLRAPRKVVALHSFELFGKAKPVAVKPATVTVQRKRGTHWRTVGTARTDANGRYEVEFVTNSPKRYLFRAKARWRNHSRATSRRLHRTVLARPDVTVSGPLTSKAVPYSYRTGCPVTPSHLRRITIDRFTYRHRVARGSLIVSAGSVPALLRVFRASFASRFPIRSMKPTDDYYASGRRTPTQSDIAAMRADNTSAFNCRPVTGNPYRVSQHSYGNAIDINTVRNPYVVGTHVYPGFARTYLRRSDVREGMLTKSGVIARMMRRNGWPWGARWAHPDYQHFSSNGG